MDFTVTKQQTQTEREYLVCNRCSVGKVIQPVHPKGDQSWCSLERLMLKLKLQYFGHLMRRADSFEKTVTLGKIEGRRCLHNSTSQKNHTGNFLAIILTIIYSRTRLVGEMVSMPDHSDIFITFRNSFQHWLLQK